MSGEIEALGGLATAGLAASALDNAAPGKVGHEGGHGACANCAAPLSGPFCGQCGQRAHIHRSIFAVFEEFLHGITHFDGKAWKTLPMLLFRPGKLTRDYIMGHRARYIAPVPLFLLVVFLMFFVFSFVNFGDNLGGVAGGATSGGKQMSRAEAIKALPGAEAEVAKLDADIKQAAKSPEPGELAALNGARIGVVAARDAIKARATGTVDTPADLPGQLVAEIANAEKDGKLSVNMGNETLNQKARKALKNPELVLYKLQAKAYKLSFLLVPLSLPWMWLMFFWRRDVGMYDHAIFTLYSISFMSLLFIAGSIAMTLGVTALSFWLPLILIAPGLHMFFQLKGAYRLSIFGALARTAFLTVGAILTLWTYVVFLVVLGVVD
ncbi:DUF3667 domain-containing protein [Sandarakinorhabdus sp.]|uniref:DUF3667 domain-containing protein n=1 Tax=Sandarakinorhabdus sp. TaxID=1916663 RepID=UPI00286E93F1|nr:DUF3667 domain-containing protein [Sandarakinorhabdus sp.]